MTVMRPGQWVTVQHQKPWKRGQPVQMRGMVTAVEGDFVRLHRLFHAPGRAYDGIRTCQAVGDWGTIEVVQGGWIARRRYFRADGELLGELYNVQTPTTFHPGEVRYVDLEIDVAVESFNGRRVDVQDEDDLARTVRAGHIRPELAEVARRISYELAERLTDATSLERVVWDVRPADVGYGSAMPAFAADAHMVG